MDQNEEYHDPDYVGASEDVYQGPTSGSEVEKVEKIRRIVDREFSLDLEARENDIMLLDQRSLLARRMLHKLRYALVNTYYNDERLKLSTAQIQDEVSVQTEPRAQASVSNLLREGQRRLHPSVRKLLGKQSSTVELHEILYRRRAPRNKSRKDYSAMLHLKKNSTDVPQSVNVNPSQVPDASNAGGAQVPSGSQVTVESHGPKKPRSLQPMVKNVLTVSDPARNQTKHRYRIIIGNTSKYAPPASSADKSTHKWLLYVRGPPSSPQLGILKGVTVRLHHSYAPHHTLHIDKPPFHISRRGWGEFPAKVELHFALPERNKSVTVEHTIKLDRQYTGFQTLGAETIVDVWLYSTEEMLQYEFKEDDDVVKTNPNTQLEKEDYSLIQPKQEIIEDQVENSAFESNGDNTHTDNWLDFFSNTTELDVDEMIIKPQKKQKETEEKPDLDNMIQSSVIQKENSENITPCIDAKIKQEVIETEVKVKTEPQYDDVVTNSWEPNNMVDINCKKVMEDIPNELLSQTTSPKKRIMKYMDPTTGKIYYLEMDRKLDLSKVQEIVINSKGNIKTAKISPIKPNGLKTVRKNKKGVSLLKPEVKSLLKNETTKVQNTPKTSNHMFSHIENDHCYIGRAPFREPEQIINNLINYNEPVHIKQEKSVYETVLHGVQRLNSVRSAVDLCLRKVPLISAEARDPDFIKHFPFVVETEEKYWKLDFAKRRNFEWSRAKFINKLLTEHLHTTETIWRTKQILIYSRMHGYYPVRQEIQRSTVSETDWSSWIDLDNRRADTDIKEIYPNASDITSLTIFDESYFCQNLSESIDLIESDEEIEIVKCNEEVSVKKEVLPVLVAELPVLPVMDTQERLRFLFLEKKCADIGIELRNEDVGSGYSYSCVHAVLLSAMKSFASELIRSALAARQSTAHSDNDAGSVWLRSSTRRTSVALPDVWLGARRNPRLHALTQEALASLSFTHVPL